MLIIISKHDLYHVYQIRNLISLVPSTNSYFPYFSWVLYDYYMEDFAEKINDYAVQINDFAKQINDFAVQINDFAKQINDFVEQINK